MLLCSANPAVLCCCILDVLQSGFLVASACRCVNLLFHLMGMCLLYQCLLWTGN